MRLATARRKNGWVKETQDLIRGACGGLLFGIPLLYTMEVWWIGSYAKPPMILGAIALMFGVVFLLNRTDGFRSSGRDHHWSEAVMDTVEAIAIGLVCATLILWLLNELNADTALRETLGKIVFECVPFTLGVALANQFLGDSSQTAQSQNDDGSNNTDNLNETLSDIGATLIGALVIAFNIAPTDEIPMLAAAVEQPRLLLILATSLLVSYGIVFQANFANQRKRMRQKGIFQRPLSETIMSYLVSLIAAMLMLWFFQKVSFSDPWTVWLEQSLVLGLPAAVGGSAGRLAV